MQPFDDEIFEALTNGPPTRGPGRILLVGERATRSEVRRVLESHGHEVIIAGVLTAARDILCREQVDLVLVDRWLSDGNAIELIKTIDPSFAFCKIIVIAEQTDPADVVMAMRMGVTDYLSWPIDGVELLDRAEAALLQARCDRQRDMTINKLKRICSELDTARLDVSRQVDLLCSDLASAYQTIAEQVNEATMITEFRTLVRQELDVEELLRTTLEYLLTKVGPTNAAVFLPDADHEYGLGAYVNYDCPREAVGMLLDHLCRAICPQMEGENDIIEFDDAAEFAQWIGADAEFMAQSQVIAYSCMHEGRCLAVVVMFRDANEPFGDDIADVTDALRPIFAEQLARVIHVHHRATSVWPEEAIDDEIDFDDYGFGIAA